MIASNYLGKGKRLDDPAGKGRDVAVSRGANGDLMYDFGPMRYEAARIQADHPRSAVRFICPINSIVIAGFTANDPDGSVFECQLCADGFLTKPTRIWYSAQGARDE